MFNKLKQAIALAEEKEFEANSLDILIDESTFDSELEEFLKLDIQEAVLTEDEIIDFDPNDPMNEFLMSEGCKSKKLCEEDDEIKEEEKDDKVDDKEDDEEDDKEEKDEDDKEEKDEDDKEDDEEKDEEEDDEDLSESVTSMAVININDLENPLSENIINVYYNENNEPFLSQRDLDLLMEETDYLLTEEQILENIDSCYDDDLVYKSYAYLESAIELADVIIDENGDLYINDNQYNEMVNLTNGIIQESEIIRMICEAKKPSKYSVKTAGKKADQAEIRYNKASKEAYRKLISGQSNTKDFYDAGEKAFISREKRFKDIKERSGNTIQDLDKKGAVKVSSENNSSKSDKKRKREYAVAAELARREAWDKKQLGTKSGFKKQFEAGEKAAKINELDLREKDLKDATEARKKQEQEKAATPKQETKSTTAEPKKETKQETKPATTENKQETKPVATETKQETKEETKPTTAEPKKDGMFKKAGKFISKNKKGLAIGGAALGTLAAAGTGYYLYKKHKAKKEEEQRKKLAQENFVFFVDCSNDEIIIESSIINALSNAYDLSYDELINILDESMMILPLEYIPGDLLESASLDSVNEYSFNIFKESIKNPTLEEIQDDIEEDEAIMDEAAVTQADVDLARSSVKSVTKTNFKSMGNILKEEAAVDGVESMQKEAKRLFKLAKSMMSRQLRSALNSTTSKNVGFVTNNDVEICEISYEDYCDDNNFTDEQEEKIFEDMEEEISKITKRLNAESKFEVRYFELDNVFTIHIKKAKNISESYDYDFTDLLESIIEDF